MRTQSAILRDIDRYEPSDGNWTGLDNLLDELWSVGPTESAIPVLLRVFDRFPAKDGCGAFWSIVHGLERLPGCEPQLRRSASENPTEFKRIMLLRIENAEEV